MERKSSRNLGIIGICLGWLSPIVGVTLGVIGLSIRKDDQNRDRDIALNIVSISWSILWWIIWLLIE